MLRVEAERDQGHASPSGDAACLAPIREQIKTLVGGQIILHPTAQGHLEAELAGDYAGFLKLTGEKSKIMVVAGACNYR